MTPAILNSTSKRSYRPASFSAHQSSEVECRLHLLIIPDSLTPHESRLTPTREKGLSSGEVLGAHVGELAALANAAVWALTGVITKGVGKNVRAPLTSSLSCPV